MPVELHATRLLALSKRQYCGLVRLLPVALAVKVLQVALVCDRAPFKDGIARACVKHRTTVVSRQASYVFIQYDP